ncbi:MAG: hypothetical protein QW757_04175 [Candidatus Woesearchaeota archaeon]
MNLEKKILLFILFLSFVLFLFSFIFIYFDIKTQEKFFIDRSIALSSSFMSSLNKESINNEKIFFDHFVRFRYNNPDLEKVEIIYQSNNELKIEKDEEYLVVYLPFESSGKKETTFKFFFLIDSLNKIKYQKIISLSLIYFLILLMLFLVMIYYSKNYIIKPINNLIRDIDNMKKGKSIIKSKISNDELGILKRYFYEFFDELQESKKKIEEHDKELEKSIKEKTKELEIKIAELEKFQKITIDRELKMIELKKKLENFANKKNEEKTK